MTYKEILINSKTQDEYDSDKHNISDDSIVFIEDRTKIITKGKTYQMIPECNKNNQVLMWDGEKPVWVNDINSFFLDKNTYGVSWKPKQKDPHLKRIGNIDMHKSLPIQSGMKGCVFNPVERKVVYWLNKDNWKYTEYSYYNNKFNLCSVYFQNQRITKLNPNQIITVDIALDSSIKGPLTLNLYTDYDATRDIGTDTGIKLKFLNDYSQGTNYNARLRYVGDTAVDLDSNKKYTGRIVSDLSGYDGEVMVYIPEFWIKSWKTEEENIVRISSIYIDKTWEHQEAFFISAYATTKLNSVPENMGYLSTLNVGSRISVVNNNDYCRGGIDDVKLAPMDSLYEDNRMLCNLGKPLVATADYNSVIEENKYLKYLQHRNICWLYFIEYANFDVRETYNSELTEEGFRQGGLGNINSNISDFTQSLWAKMYGCNPTYLCGDINIMGNNTYVGEYTHINRYRGLENFILNEYPHYIADLFIGKTENDSFYCKENSSSDITEYNYKALNYNYSFVDYNSFDTAYYLSDKANEDYLLESNDFKLDLKKELDYSMGISSFPSIEILDKEVQKGYLVKVPCNYTFNGKNIINFADVNLISTETEVAERGLYVNSLDCLNYLRYATIVGEAVKTSNEKEFIIQTDNDELFSVGDTIMISVLGYNVEKQPVGYLTGIVQSKEDNRLIIKLDSNKMTNPDNPNNITSMITGEKLINTTFPYNKTNVFNGCGPFNVATKYQSYFSVLFTTHVPKSE